MSSSKVRVQSRRALPYGVEVAAMRGRARSLRSSTGHYDKEKLSREGEL